MSAELPRALVHGDSMSLRIGKVGSTHPRRKSPWSMRQPPTSQPPRFHDAYLNQNLFVSLNSYTKRCAERRSSSYAQRLLPFGVPRPCLSTISLISQISASRPLPLATTGTTQWNRLRLLLELHRSYLRRLSLNITSQKDDPVALRPTT